MPRIAFAKLLFLKLIFGLFSFLFLSGFINWGFFAHKEINRLAIFTLPPEMLVFYKQHIRDLTENAVNPDRRRYAVEYEAPRHYIDLDVYGDSAVYKLPLYWKDAVEQYTEDTLMAYGIVPWHIQRVCNQLTDALTIGDVESVLRLSADLGHYIGDANVPLHTTENYNGQLTNQHGIHGLWESRLPELFAKDYNFFVGKANYIENTQLEAWKAVRLANEALDSVLSFEKSLPVAIDKKYAYETRGATTVKVYSYAFSKAYHDRLNGMVERQMRRAIKMVGDFWYTCWVNAGQPDLRKLLKVEISEEELEARRAELNAWKQNLYNSRPHENQEE